MLPPLQLIQPRTIAEASEILGALGERARLYAGGAELLLLLRHNFIDIDVLVDIKRIPELRMLAADDSGLRIGACLTHQELAGHPAVQRSAPAFACAEAQIANRRVRHQGTLGGNLCFNDPHSDPGTVLLIHEASVALADYKDERRLSAEEFFHNMYETALRPNEILTRVEIPPLPAAMNSAYLRLHRYQRPTLGAAAAVHVANGVISECRLAVGCVGPKPLRLRDLETQLSGAVVTDVRSLIDNRRAALRETLRPVDDLLGSADYKLYMTVFLIAEAVKEAAGKGNDYDG